MGATDGIGLFYNGFGQRLRASPGLCVGERDEDDGGDKTDGGENDEELEKPEVLVLHTSIVPYASPPRAVYSLSSRATTTSEGWQRGLSHRT